ncbi:MAG: baeRF3 domain-containing protein [Syntrophales bacterium]
MDQFTKEDLQELLAPSEELRVSLYMPTHRSPVEGRQDLVRFKNLLRETEERLVRGGLRRPEAADLAAPLQKLLRDLSFWQYRGDGLALFLSRDGVRHYRLPMQFEELVVVARRFHLKPLIPLFTDNSGFYVLALSQNQIRLLQGNRYGAWERELDHLPTSLTQALGYDEPERQLQVRGKASTGAGGGNAVFFAHGGVECCKDDIRRYFHQVDKGLQELLRPDRIPLLLAGVDYLLPIYREVNSYPHLLPEGIIGNPETLSTGELQTRAWEVVQPYLRKAGEEMISQYNRLAGTGRTSRDIKEILPAAAQGRVEKLMVASDAQVWGSFSAANQVVELHGKPADVSEDLLDLAAIQTLLNGGTIYTIEPEAVPDGSPVIALLRY